MLVLWFLVPPVDSACSATSSLASFWLHPKGATFVSISAELEAKILRYYHVEKWRVGTIAQQLQVHHRTVQRVLRRAGVPPPQRTARASKADPYVPFIRQTLERFPTPTASRVYAIPPLQRQRLAVEGVAVAVFDVTRRAIKKRSS
jgi:hypothetical protein